VKSRDVDRDARRSQIYSVVALIPPGRVSTYGRIARLAGLPGQARQVGYALSALPPENDVPWHRVVNARGEISLRGGPSVERQKKRLEAEGVAFDRHGRIALARFGWEPGGAADGADLATYSGSENT
jgi:methylated-DNA-protein-cysteine methyltransferase-like protein